MLLAHRMFSSAAGTAGRVIGDTSSGVRARTKQWCAWRPTHRPRGFICGQHCSSVDAPCAVHPATMQHQRCGRLGAYVAVGMGNTFGPGETCRRCMLISRGGATRGLTGVQCVKRRGPRYGVCAPVMHRHSNISRKQQAMTKRTAV